MTGRTHVGTAKGGTIGAACVVLVNLGLPCI
jgi:hypothetical protein